MGNRAWPQAVIDISNVSTTETSPQKYKQNSQREKKKNLGGGEIIVNKNTEFFKNIIRQPESPSATASTWVKRFTDTRMKQRRKLKCKR